MPEETSKGLDLRNINVEPAQTDEPSQRVFVLQFDTSQPEQAMENLREQLTDLDEWMTELGKKYDELEQKRASIIGAAVKKPVSMRDIAEFVLESYGVRGPREVKKVVVRIDLPSGGSLGISQSVTEPIRCGIDTCLG